MKRLWIRADVEAPAPAVWDFLVDPQKWPLWGPSLRSGVVDGGRLKLGSRGTVVTVLGLRLPFEVTAYEPGFRWAWKVAGVAATDHTVEPLGADRCRVGFGVPPAAAPYLVVCRIALGRLNRLNQHHAEPAETRRPLDPQAGAGDHDERPRRARQN